MARTIYLLHLTPGPYRHARHYLGSADNLRQRLREHAAGRGARLTQVVREAGIGWVLARTWRGSRTDERRLKQTKAVPRLCPICNPKVRLRRRPTQTLNYSPDTRHEEAA
jgi:predicted GIY-YIG superfamily endonuclease